MKYRSVILGVLKKDHFSPVEVSVNGEKSIFYWDFASWIHLPWEIKDMIPKDDSFALFSYNNFEEKDEELVAIDLISINNSKIETVRIFGDLQKSFRSSDCFSIWDDVGRLPRREVIINVVEPNNELKFEFEGCLFNRLDAGNFDGGQLSIIRNGEIFDTTSSICEYGTHGACTCFMGLRNVFKNLSYGYAVDSLGPDNLLKGDVIKVEYFSIKKVRFC